MSLSRVPPPAPPTRLGEGALGRCVLAARDIAAGEVVDRFVGR